MEINELIQFQFHRFFFFFFVNSRVPNFRLAISVCVEKSNKYINAMTVRIRLYRGNFQFDVSTQTLMSRRILANLKINAAIRCFTNLKWNSLQNFLHFWSDCEVFFFLKLWQLKYLLRLWRELLLRCRENSKITALELVDRK